MRRSAQAYCWDILRAINEIRGFLEPLDYLTFVQSRVTQLAIERSFENIGEALRQAKTLYGEVFASVTELQLAVDMRNRLAHGYFAVKQEILWVAVEDDLPKLEISIRAVLSKLPVATSENEAPL